MTTTTTPTRSALLKTLNILRPALATQNYIPAWMHVRFAGAWATAYNDISAIAVRCEEGLGGLELCLPGDLLIRALGSFKGEALAVTESKDGGVQLTSGRAKMKLPSLPLDAFAFDFPGVSKIDPIAVDERILKGIELCLGGVGKDSTHPAQLGVTLEAENGVAVLYSTDNYTISRYRTASKVELPGDAPIIIPTFFAEQLLAVAKAFPAVDEIDLYVVPGGLVATFGTVARLFTKTLVDLEPLDFPTVLERLVKLKTITSLVDTIPDAFEGALERALLVLTNEVDKVTKCSAAGTVVKLRTSSSLGDSDDTLPFEPAAEQLDEPVKIDPALVLRGSKGCAKMAFLPRALLLTSEDCAYMHVVSYCA